MTDIASFPEKLKKKVVDPLANIKVPALAAPATNTGLSKLIGLKSDLILEVALGHISSRLLERVRRRPSRRSGDKRRRHPPTDSGTGLDSFLPQNMPSVKKGGGGVIYKFAHGAP